MKNIIKYFYNIDIENIKEYDNYYIVDDYILKKIDNIDINLYNFLINNNIYINKIIPNINNELITIINKNKYILMLYNKDKITLANILNYDNIVIDDKYIDWSKLWEVKVDYYEKEIVNINNKKVLSIFPYYIGLSECAIRIYKENKNNLTKSISHKKLNNYKEFYSITNISIDYKVRDIAEYIKYEFFSGNKIDINEILNIGLTNDDLIILYARLLFPTYFYNCIENNENIDLYYSYINQYEDYLNEIYYKLIRYVDIPYIEWLIKKV